MPLTDMKLRALKAAPQAGKHGDRDGLFLRIDAKGRMYWQWRIRTPQGGRGELRQLSRGWPSRGP